MANISWNEKKRLSSLPRQSAWRRAWRLLETNRPLLLVQRPQTGTHNTYKCTVQYSTGQYRTGQERGHAASCVMFNLSKTPIWLTGKCCASYTTQCSKCYSWEMLPHTRGICRKKRLDGPKIPREGIYRAPTPSAFLFIYLSFVDCSSRYPASLGSNSMTVWRACSIRGVLLIPMDSPGKRKENHILLMMYFEFPSSIKSTEIDAGLY